MLLISEYLHRLSFEAFWNAQILFLLSYSNKGNSVMLFVKEGSLFFICSWNNKMLTVHINEKEIAERFTVGHIQEGKRCIYGTYVPKGLKYWTVQNTKDLLQNGLQKIKKRLFYPKVLNLVFLNFTA